MIQKYAMMGMGGLIFIMATTMLFMNNSINNLEQEVALLTAQNIACELSQNGLKNSIARQNDTISDFEVILKKKDITLAKVAKVNSLLQSQLNEKRQEIEQVENATCEDTINWMLEEAIGINENINTSTDE